MPQPRRRDPALVFEEEQNGPGTHVLLIGLGDYPWLVDGKKENLEIAAGMGQLTSAPLSARALGKWFLDGRFVNPERPLASVAMVLSEKRRAKFEHPRLTYPKNQLPRGDAAEVVKAIQDWLARASFNRENFLFLFFCGHGSTAGNSVLLCRDYGKVPDARFEGAINLNSLVGSLATKIPEYQLLVIDACSTPDAVLEYFNAQQSSGRNALDVSSLRDRGGRSAKQSVCLASSPFEEAYGRQNEVSIYTEALFLALEGGGAVRQDDWWVGTNRLHEALETHTSRLAAAEKVEQQPERIRSASFRVHRPDVVRVPVSVNVAADEVIGHSFGLAVDQDAVVENFDFEADYPGSPPWIVSLKAAPAQLTARFAHPCPIETAAATEPFIMPPECDVLLVPEGDDL